jgi:hypothetical protein
MVLNWQGGNRSRAYLLKATPSNQPNWTVIYTNTPPTGNPGAFTNQPSSSAPLWFRLKAARPSVE